MLNTLSLFVNVGIVGIVGLGIVCMTACGEDQKQVQAEALAPELVEAAEVEHTEKPSGQVAVETVAELQLSLEQQAWKNIAAGDRLIDVRTQEEYDQGHLENALLIPHGLILDGVKKAGIASEDGIVVYCRSGGRAGHAMKALHDAGYVRVLNAGGYEKMLAAQPVASTPTPASTSTTSE